jgi:hypothetical protein
MNAADKVRVRAQSEFESRRRERYLTALRVLLSVPEGRLVLWELLSKAGVYSSCFDTQSLRMAALAGQQAHGQEVLADVLAAGEDLYDVMAREARARRRKDEDEQAAFEADALARRQMEG